MCCVSLMYITTSEPLAIHPKTVVLNPVGGKTTREFQSSDKCRRMHLRNPVNIRQTELTVVGFMLNSLVFSICTF